MKKIISIVILVAILLTTIMTTSCGEVVGCDLCNNEDKKSKMHKLEIFEEKTIMCDRCYDEMVELAEAFK